MKKSLKLIVVGLVALFMFGGCGNDKMSEKERQEYSEKNYEACIKIVKEYRSGVDDTEKSIAKAVQHCNVACENGESEVQYNSYALLGHIYLSGYGVKKNKNKAFKYFEKSCRLGNIRLCKYLYQAYKYGDDRDGMGIEKNLNESKKYFTILKDSLLDKPGKECLSAIESKNQTLPTISEINSCTKIFRLDFARQCLYLLNHNTKAYEALSDYEKSYCIYNCDVYGSGNMDEMIVKEANFKDYINPLLSHHDMLSYVEEITKAQTTVKNIRYALEQKRQKEVLRGIFSGYPFKLSSSAIFGEPIFDGFNGDTSQPILDYKLFSCLSATQRGCWRETITGTSANPTSTYIYNMPTSGSVTFTLINNKFVCEDSPNCKLLTNTSF